MQKGSTSRQTRQGIGTKKFLALANGSKICKDIAAHSAPTTVEPAEPTPKRISPRRFTPDKPSVQPTEFKIGDAVYARWQGDRILKIVGIADVKTPVIHYICELDGEKHVISKMHLSTKSLISEVGGGNRRQLKLPI